MALLYDIRERIIPDELTVGGTLFMILFWITSGEYAVVPFALGTFTIFYVLYQLGVVAGGDAKLFTFLSAAFPVFLHVSGVSVPFVLAVFVVALIASFAYIFTVALLRMARDRQVAREVLAAMKLAVLRATPTILAYPSLGVFSVVLSFLPPRIGLPVAIALAVWRHPPLMYLLNAYALLVLGTLLIQVLFRRSYLFSRYVPIDALEEGDVPGVFVLADGRLVPPSPLRVALALAGRLPFIAGPLRAGGVTREDIERMRALGVRELPVMDTLPFAPFVLAGFLFVLSLIFSGVVVWTFPSF